MRFTVSAAFVCLTMLASMIAFPPAALPQAACEPTEATIAKARTADPEIGVEADLMGAAALQFVATLNATEPKTDYAADRVIVLRHPRQPDAFLVVLSRAGCIVRAGWMTGFDMRQTVDGVIPKPQRPI